MDIEFHYYIIFIISRKAGFNANDSYTIAYSSQYTDDNNFRYFVNFKGGDFYLNEISQTLDITKPSEKRQKIYPLFHFIPSGEEIDSNNQFKRNSYHSFITIPDSINAQTLFDAALVSKNLYRIGIAVHAYADTWAHQNFLGLKDNLNGKRGFEKIIPNIGHADFIHEPDKVHNEWIDTRLKNQYADISNDERFLAAAKNIFIRLWKYNRPRKSDQQAKKAYEELNLEAKLKDAMDETYFWGSDEKARIKSYKNICNELGMKKYQYDPNEWRYEAIEKHSLEIDLFDRYWAKNKFEGSRWHEFQEAVKAHRDLALKNFKPLYEKAGLPI